MSEVESQSSSGSQTGLWIGIGVGVFVLLAVAVLLFMKLSPQPVPAPTSYAAYDSPGHAFTCSVPAGWNTQGESAQGIAEGVVITNGAAKIHIIADLQGSLMGDVAKATNDSISNLGSLAPGMPMPNLPPPVEQVHKADAKVLADKLDDYEEGPAQKFTSRIGDSRFSEFTATGGTLVGKLHGYRVTMLGSQKRFSVVCECREPDWNTLRPAFVQVINSVTPGTG